MRFKGLTSFNEMCFSCFTYTVTIRFNEFTTRQLITPNESPKLVYVGTVWYPSTNSSLRISIFRIHQIFNISYFLQFNLSFEKKYLFPKMPKNHPKIYTKPPNRGYGYKHRDIAFPRPPSNRARSGYAISRGLSRFLLLDFT